MDKFLDTCVLLSLNQEEAETSNRPITRAEVEAAINSLATKNKPRSRWVHSQILPDIQRGAGTTPSETFQTIQKEGILPKSFYETNIILIPKPGRDSTNKGNFRPISIVNIDAKLFNKILANRLQQQIKKLIPSRSSRLHPRDASLVQHMQIYNDNS